MCESVCQRERERERDEEKTVHHITTSLYLYFVTFSVLFMDASLYGNCSYELEPEQHCFLIQQCVTLNVSETWLNLM